MRTICLRFSDAFAPKEGTIRLHQEEIEKNGYVWYGKLGNKISEKVLNEIVKSESKKILLVKSGSTERYWATVVAFDYEYQKEHPSYYTDYMFMKTWLKITKIEKAPDDIINRCTVASTKKCLADIFKKTMSACFIVDIE